MRSRTSVPTSGDSDAMTWSNLVRWAVIHRVVKVASTCANHTSGSEGQKGGSLTDTVATAGDSALGSSKVISTTHRLGSPIWLDS